MLTAAAVAVGVIVVSVAAWLLLRVELRDQTATDLSDQATVFANRTDPTKLQQPPAWVRQDVNTLFGVVSTTGMSRKPPFQSQMLPVSPDDVAVALGTEDSSLRDVTVDHVPYLMLTVHSVRGDAVQLATDLSDVDTTLTNFALLLVMADTVAIVIAAALGYGFTVAGLSPVRRVGAAAAHVAETQDLGAEVTIRPDEPAEVASVAASLNQMLAALGHARDAQRQLVEDASHELATPLTSLRTNIELLLHAERNPDRELDSGDRQRLLKDIEAQMGELDNLIEEVVELARDPGSAEEATEQDLAEVVASAVSRARARSPEVIFELSESPVRVLGKRSLLERAVLNLLDNAAKWNTPERPVEVSVGRVDELADVVVADRGPGVPEEDQERVFQRFYRTAEARAMPGSGLGLAIVRQVVTVHGGRVWLAPRVGGGTEAHIQIPARRDRTAE
ncbi:MAG TPA: HAMP domain-containing sensor histidine kinase [Pseudonocardiaceae bacterium]